MKKFLKFLLYTFVSLIIAAGAILYAFTEVADAVVETIDDVHDINNYKTFVDDAVRYTLASANPKYIYMDSNLELQSKADRKIDDIASTYDVDQPSYKLALEKVSKEGNSFEKKYAAGLLKIYNDLNISLTPFQKNEEKEYQWYFQEKNSRVHFTVSVGVLSYCDADIWDLERYTDYLETGVFKSAPRASNDEATKELDIKDISKDMDENPVVELIRSRISAQYAGVYTDKQIMSNAFYSLFLEAQQTDESEIGWPDWDYWNCTNGADANLSSVDVEIKSTNTAVAHVVLSYPEAGSFTKVDMPMVYENGNWFVDDIISYENNEKWSLRKSAEAVIMNAK